MRRRDSRWLAVCLCEWPGEPAGAVDEQFRDRVQRPVPQCNDRHRPGSDRQLHRQCLDRRRNVAECDGVPMEVAPGGKRLIAQVKRERNNPALRQLQAARPKCLRHQRSRQFIQRSEAKGSSTRSDSAICTPPRPGAVHSRDDLKLLLVQDIRAQILLQERSHDPAHHQGRGCARAAHGNLGVAVIVCST